MRNGRPQVSLLASDVSAPPSASLELVDDDVALVARIRRGDVAAFEALFRYHYRGLLGFARSLVATMAEAEEVVQDVLTGVWATRNTWTVQAGVPAYLYGAVRNRCIRSGKHAQVIRRHEQGESFEGKGAYSVLRADDRVEAIELATVARAAIEALPERCRTVYILRRQYDLSYAEIAAAMGTSVHTVNAQLGRAFAALRRAVNDWRGEPRL